MDCYERIYNALSEQCSEAAFQWLIKALEKIEGQAAIDENYQIVSAMARRKVGDEPFEGVLLDNEGAGIPSNHWTCSDAARILMTITLLKVSEQSREAVLSQVYAQGDERERAALLMGLSLLDPGAQWLVEAEDCCRTNSLILLAAVAMNNPYPSQHFSSRAFNQLVLKSLFLGLNIDNVVGLAFRLNSELSMMCADYIEERLAASRDYPASIWLAIGWPDCPENIYPVLADSIVADELSSRYYAAMSLLPQRGGLPNVIMDAVHQQQAVEPDSQVRAILSQLIE